MKNLKTQKDLQEFTGELISIFDEHAKTKLKWENNFINGADYDVLTEKIKNLLEEWHIYKYKKGKKK